MSSTITRVLSVDIGIINMAYCIIDFWEKPGSAEYEFSLVHIEKRSIGTIRQSMYELMINVIAFLNEAEPIHAKTIDVVLIEKQLPRAIKNVVLSFVVMTYVHVRCTNDARFVQSWKKFDAVKYVFQKFACVQQVDFKKRGSRPLKQLSVELATRLFAEFQCLEGLRAIEEYRPKIDDICDVFLQSFTVFLQWRRFIATPTLSDSA
ncbi:FirrV-1-B26 [Feldmannia irregularis virus a]|uniref:FirrV-1-B26 n=1 Tax=Feldmannia irregularis virus a TaxID=231992 RepID=Q6XM10_9PHYC|nr:FirrV-1-B26 [Feldmannia irregularis virus a]AAR26901.1 FirrV-1-B26 [Feldmannia irregularis virus a]